MKKKFLFGMVLGLMLISAKPITAQDHGFGLGIIFGEPTGLSAKLWTSKVNAFDFGLGWSVGGDRSLIIKIDTNIMAVVYIFTWIISGTHSMQ